MAFKRKKLAELLDAEDVEGVRKFLSKMSRAKAAEVLSTSLENGLKLTPLHVAIEHGNFLMAKLMLSFGADPNRRDNQGWTALHAAALVGNVDIVKELLDFPGIYLNMQSHEKSTPLHYLV